MSSDSLEWEPDYEGMYQPLSKQKREYKDQLSAVILSSTTLESLVNKLVEIGVKKVQSPLLERQLKNVYIPIGNKLKLLRFAGLIDEKLHENLTILFKIRNKFSHELFITTKESTTIFEILKGFHTNSDFLRGLPNDSKKFELMVSGCALEILRICKKLDPTSVKSLGYIDDIKEIHEYE
jgi:intergrase/recombinase